MLIKYIFKSAWKALSINKSRSALTILGIVIGITAIMLVVSLGKGAENLILGELQGMGAKTIVVMPGREPKGPTDPSAIDSLFSDSLKDRELNALKNKANAPTISRIMPVVFGSETASYKSETYRLSVLGGTEIAADIFDIETGEGSFITEEDVKNRADVVVLGSKVKEELFGLSEAIGERIKIKDRNLRVVGVIPKKGQVSLFNFDDMVLVPYTTAQSYLFGIKHFNRLIVEADTEENIDRTVNDIELTLRNLHNITDPEKDDFFIETQASIVEMVSVVTGVLTLFLAAVAAISLLVGGVGIMNIMLVSVTERTREIGLRKALGATRKNILTQFLLESIFLTVIGGIFGILLGTLLAFGTSIAIVQFADLAWEFTFPVLAAILGVSVSGVVGLVFGLYPARQASKKSPMEALRYE